MEAQELVPQINPGKELTINFIGYSVPQTQKFLHLHSINFQFTPIPIGTPYPPIQYYRLMNCSSQPLEFSIDIKSIDEVTSF
jgi:hypothetical protein